MVIPPRGSRDSRKAVAMNKRHPYGVMEREYVTSDIAICELCRRHGSRSHSVVVDQAKKEIRVGYTPALQSKIDHIESYDTIFVGSPNWWSTIAPPVTTFLSEYDLSGKTIVPFCTHGGGGLGRIGKEIAKLCPQSIILSSFEIYGSGTGNAQTTVSAWLRKVGMTQ